MVPTESYNEQLDRVKLMASGDDQWDLSENDLTALRTVLQERTALLKALKAVTRLLTIAADEIDTDVHKPLQGYGGKTVRENIHDAELVLAQAEQEVKS